MKLPTMCRSVLSLLLLTGHLCTANQAQSPFPSANLRHGNHADTNHRLTTTSVSIPHVIWFASEHNLIVTKQPQDVYENVERTVNEYLTLWNEPDAPVHFLNSNKCEDQVSKAEPALAEFFRNEPSVVARSDMCRAAVLYLHGGYFFDVNGYVATPYTPAEGIAAVAARSCAGECVSPTFAASSRLQPFMKQALRNMLSMYQVNPDKSNLTGIAMAHAYHDMQMDGKYGVHYFEPPVPDQKMDIACQPEFHDATSGTIYFFADFRTHCADALPEQKTSEVAPEQTTSEVAPEQTTSEVATAQTSSEVAPAQTSTEVEPVQTSPEVEPVQTTTSQTSPVVQTNQIVPHNLIFTFKTNLLQTKQPSTHYSNVMRTIAAYDQALTQSDQDQTTVLFFDDDKCEEAIQRVMPDLVPYFRNEPVRSYKADICRLAALFMHGGYYFDVDLLVVEPIFLTAEEGFATTWGCGGGCFFQAFIAATPGHPILAKALQNMLELYQHGGDTSMLGPTTLANAYEEIGKEFRGQVRFLEELQLDLGPQENLMYYPEIPRQKGGGNCNQVVHDPERKVVFFFERYLGYGSCQPIEGEDGGEEEAKMDKQFRR